MLGRRKSGRSNRQAQVGRRKRIEDGTKEPRGKEVRGRRKRDRKSWAPSEILGTLLERHGVNERHIQLEAGRAELTR